MLLMLASAALFVYLRLRADLDDRINASLQSRVAALLDPGGEPSLAGVALEDPEETFVQLLSPTGEVLDSVGTLRVPALAPVEARRASAEMVTLERELPGVDGRARLLADAEPGEGAIVVVGRSLVDRNDALANVVSSFVVGGAVAIALASMIGYLLATAGLAPVEAMRRRASEVSLRSSDKGLPLPAAHDEIRRLGETLNEMLARLRAAFDRESRFVADASHELRTPIAIIKTELEGALQVPGTDTSVYASLAAASEECDRLAQLAEDLLVLARAAGGQLPMRLELVKARAVLDRVRDRFADRAGRNGRVIRVDCAPDLLMHADPVRVRQALGNLVENALRHGEGEVVLVARASAGGVEMDVTDEGAGFPQDFVTRAFERFARGDRARTGDGVGLGLAIVQAIAEAHGGSADVMVAVPTTLRIWLPNAT
ncbi:MAG: two-component sensor histidine kinase [Actinobacteria bacterium]|nr:two-component sensor histidine kinase [Actinomycetota bacterium]